MKDVYAYHSIDRYSPHVIASVFFRVTLIDRHCDCFMFRRLLWPHSRGPACCMSFDVWFNVYSHAETVHRSTTRITAR